jgi:hypothetical protein
VNDTSASGGRAVRWNKPGTTGTVNFTISEPADSVSVYIKAGQQRLQGVRAPDGRQHGVGNPTFMCRR